MEVLLAKYAGFCFGVERAIDIVEQTAKDHESVLTLGPIIHNPQVVESLSAKGVHPIENPDDITTEDIVILRSHGVPKHLQKRMNDAGITLVDATCPFVKKAQAAAEKLSNSGHSVVLLGEKDHPEVEGIVSYIGSSDVYVISGVEEARGLPAMEKCGFLAQTTQPRESFHACREELAKKCGSLEVVETICNATSQRQSAAIELAREVDVMIVVGGKNSANTTRLAHICQESCPRTHHVETRSELTSAMFDGARCVGITAGASTPTDLMYDVLEYVKEVGR